MCCNNGQRSLRYMGCILFNSNIDEQCRKTNALQKTLMEAVAHITVVAHISVLCCCPNVTDLELQSEHFQPRQAAHFPIFKSSAQCISEVPLCYFYTMSSG